MNTKTPLQQEAERLGYLVPQRTPDQRWRQVRTWTGEVRYVPGNERSEFVRHEYTPLDNLKRTLRDD
jgi:hypothetical protein